MANNRIIFPDGDGTMSVMTPASSALVKLTQFDTIDKKLIHLADKSLPTGTKYELIDESVDLSDRTFRNAWEYTADASVEKTSADLSADELKEFNMSEQRQSINGV